MKHPYTHNYELYYTKINLKITEGNYESQLSIRIEKN